MALIVDMYTPTSVCTFAFPASILQLPVSLTARFDSEGKTGLINIEVCFYFWAKSLAIVKAVDVFLLPKQPENWIMSPY